MESGLGPATLFWPRRTAVQVHDWRNLDRDRFGDTPALADELLALIIAGKKRATCWSAAEGLRRARVGKSWVAEDGQRRPRVVLRTTELREGRFDQVDASFAADEGEGIKASLTGVKSIRPTSPGMAASHPTCCCGANASKWCRQ
ncbi:MAG TPA: ASCH domain-containing protein [Phenylobacterium sp.]